MTDRGGTNAAVALATWRVHAASIPEFVESASTPTLNLNRSGLAQDVHAILQDPEVTQATPRRKAADGTTCEHAWL